MSGRVQRFQEQFRRWLGPDPEAGAATVAQMSGYSLDYVRWAAGLVGNGSWPGSRRFVRRMRALGCTDKPWHDRSPEQIRQALETREVLFEPGMG
jgi:hypothetical protein